jgi:hypothetical protein
MYPHSALDCRHRSRSLLEQVEVAVTLREPLGGVKDSRNLTRFARLSRMSD